MLPVYGLVALLGWLLSLGTTRVVNWFVMTDELHYERLAISIAQTGSIVPRFRGEGVGSFSQLYPIVISPLFGAGDVAQSLSGAHRLNAFLMASAAIPVFILARHVGSGRIVSLWVAALAVATPWCVLSSFLMTESVAYPAACWAILALVIATHRKSNLWDGLAFLSIAVALLARTQFAILLLAFPVAVVIQALLEELGTRRTAESNGRTLAHRLRVAARARVLLVSVYAALTFLFLVGVVTGHATEALGRYAVTAQGIRVDGELLSLAGRNVAVLALATGFLPVLLGLTWLVDRLRPAARAPERALAVVGCVTMVLFALEVASFDQRFGAGEIKDRYFFYVLPLALVGMGAVVSQLTWPAWWAWLLPSAVVLVGLTLVRLPTYEKLNVDSPAAIYNNQILRLSTSLGWAHVLLPLAVLVALGLLYTVVTWFSTRAGAALVAALVTLALPGGAVYAFDRLFAVDGTNGLPVTLDQGGVFGWVDRNLGADARVTMIPYPVNSADYWAGVAYWWDVEFWNEIVVDSAQFVTTRSNDLAWLPAFDPATGAMMESGSTRYVLVAGPMSASGSPARRSRSSAARTCSNRRTPWRADWVTDGIYGDGWTRPHVPARIRVYAKPGPDAASHPLRDRVGRGTQHGVALAVDDPDESRRLAWSDRALGDTRPTSSGVCSARWFHGRRDRDAGRVGRLPGSVREPR